MDTTKLPEQVTEWGAPYETVDVVVQGSSTQVGMPIKTHRITYLEWCRAEAKRIRGRVKKDNRMHSDESGHASKKTVIAVFI